MTAPNTIKMIVAATLVAGSLITTSSSADAGPRLIGFDWSSVSSGTLGSGR